MIRRLITPTTFSLLLAGAVVAFSALARMSQPSFLRPIQTDELITLENYTWAGTHVDGTRREIQSQSDIDDLRGVSFRRFVVGLYCSLGRWPEPYNHVPHSLLADVALLLPCDTMTAIRMPPLACCMAFAILSAYLCIRCGILYASPLVALLAMWHPYCIQYSQESRGYSLMLALSVAMVLVLKGHAAHRRSIAWGSCVVCIGVLTFMNLVNMALDWLLPLFAVSIVAPRVMLGVRLNGDDAVDWRRSTFVELMIIGLAGMIFLMDRLPYVYSSSRQYGVEIFSLGQVSGYISEIAQTFAPTSMWAAFLCVGLLGSTIALRSARMQPMACPWLLAVIVLTAHVMISHRAPYVRNMGLLLPAVLFGIAIVVESLVMLSVRKRTQIITAGILTSGIGAAVILNARTDLLDHSYIALTNALETRRSLKSEVDVLLLGEGVASPVRLYVPQSPAREAVVASGGPANIMIIEKAIFPFQLTQGHDKGGAAGPLRWAEDQIDEIGGYRVHWVPGVCLALDDWNRNSNALCIWSPSFSSTYLSESSITAALDEANLPYTTVRSRYQAKMEVFSRLCRVIVDVSPDLRLGNEGGTPIEKVKEIACRFGGEVCLFAPSRGENFMDD